jgi:formate dehydrogenase subunit beta
MSLSVKIEVKNQDLLASLQVFFKSVLEQEPVSALLVPQKLPMKNTIMPTLVTNPEQLSGVDPLAPYFPMNASKIVSRLSRKSMGGKVVAVLRPCEIRAFVELVKLKQGRTEELIIMGLDCLGAYGNTDYFKFAGDDVKQSTIQFVEKSLNGNGSQVDGIERVSACKVCEHFIPEGADILVGLLGVDYKNHLLVKSQSQGGEDLLSRLDLPGIKEPGKRQPAIDALLTVRKAARDRMFEETAEATGDIEKLTTYLANCINCYNCRVACPVCYCKECVFVTDVFNHDPAQYLQWARRKGTIKMPTDTAFYHLTRLAHMSTACVGCGQCSNACPNDIPVMEIFKTVSYQTQKAFEYEAGRNVDEVPPLSTFREDEFRDVVGLE